MRINHAQILSKYFDLTGRQYETFVKLGKLFRPLNDGINLISRKDIDHFYERHVLHSLAIAKFIEFLPGSNILDVGTGGGFPGLPLAIYFPEVRFHLVDSIDKKIRAIRYLTDALELKNVTTERIRVEKHHGKYDFVVSRAVARMDKFYAWTRKNISEKNKHKMPNGILYLKGGDLAEELKNFPRTQVIPLSGYFDEEFFKTKKLVYLPETKNTKR